MNAAADPATATNAQARNISWRPCRVIATKKKSSLKANFMVQYSGKLLEKTPKSRLFSFQALSFQCLYVLHTNTVGGRDHIFTVQITTHFRIKFHLGR
jgi:hypothetical protein